MTTMPSSGHKKRVSQETEKLDLFIIIHIFSTRFHLLSTIIQWRSKFCGLLVYSIILSTNVALEVLKAVESEKVFAVEVLLRPNFQRIRVSF